MTATAERTPASSTPQPPDRDGFGRVLRAEWRKLWSVRRWVFAIAFSGIATVLLGLLAADASGTDANEVPDFATAPDGQPTYDQFRFMHQALPGDGTITVRVTAQEASHPDAGAGLMIKKEARPGSPYAAIMATPEHGVRLSANFKTEDSEGTGAGAPRWLRLTRAGATVTGYVSTDGTTWREVGSVRPEGLTGPARVGLFVSSPPQLVVERQAGSTSVLARGTTGRATFEPPVLEGGGAPPGTGPGAWTTDDIGPAAFRKDPRATDPPETSVRADEAFTLVGTGEIGGDPFSDDMVQISLFGVLLAMMVVAPVGVVFMTSEFRRGMIRTTFAASPRRGRVLAAKAVVLSALTFPVSLVACLLVFFVAMPRLRDSGFSPPAYPMPEIFDPGVPRALLLTSAFLCMIAVVGLAVGAILRHTAGAVTTTLALVVLPIFLGAALPATAAEWIMRLTPAGGLATQRAKPPTLQIVEPWAMISPWAGIGIAAAYALGGLLIGSWLLRSRDT